MTGTIQEFDFSVNLMRALLWQYNEASSLQSLLQQKQDWYDQNQTEFWTDWYTDVFNLQTANTFGLNVWAIILDLAISVQTAPSSTKPKFGFNPYWQNFNNSNFAQQNAGVIILTPDQARIVLQMRYFQLTSNCSVTDINRALNAVFSSYGDAYVIDNHDMTITYVFRFIPPAQLDYVLTHFDVLPRPAGVGASLEYIAPGPWGFKHNFDNHNFKG